MHLQQLSVINFRNYSSLRLEFSPQWNLLTGENGTGKTTVLDAIHYLCLGKSYFHYSDFNSVKHDSPFFRLEGSFAGEPLLKMTCTFEAGGKKELQRNGVPYSRIADHVGVIPVVMVTPDDQLLIDEGSEERRRFVDSTLSQIDHDYLECLIEYGRILQQRNAALRQFAERRKIDQALIDSYDEKLCDSGERIYETRLKFFAQMVPLVREFYAQLSSGAESVTAEYDSVCSRQKLNLALKNSFEKDCLTQRTNEGLHRDDFHFYLGGKPLKKFGSQGQKKSFLIALKFSQYELIRDTSGLQPILLLDDIFDKLDEKRSESIFRLLTGNGFGQVFITDTHPDRIDSIPAAQSATLKRFTLPATTSSGTPLPVS